MVCKHGCVSFDVFPALVPGLLITDLARSVAFWCGLCGFPIKYLREHEGFADISLRAAPDEKAAPAVCSIRRTDVVIQHR